MNKFLERTNKQIMESISEYVPNTGILSVDFNIDNSIGGILYRLKPIDKAKHIIILTISSEVKMSDRIAGMVYPLIDNVTENKDCLIIIHSDGKSKNENDIQTFLSEEVDLFHPNYMRLNILPQNLKASIDSLKYMGLKTMLRKYFLGEIIFVAPIAGKQFVNIEIYKDTCYICNKELSIVSGIVFPKIQLRQWDNPFWQYYSTLIPLYWLPSEYSKQIKREIEILRKEDKNITPLIYYQDVEIDEDYWTVMCPHCKTVINPYEPNDSRMKYLFNFDARMNGDLRYHSILIDASQELINLLDEMSESTPHTCQGGWVESKNIQP